MRQTGGIIALAFLVTLLAPPRRAGAQVQENPDSREIGRTTEKELKVVLSSSFGTVVLSKGEPEKMLVAESSDAKNGDPRMNVEYSIRNRIGYMEISLGEDNQEGDGKKGGFRISGFDGGKWDLKFSDAVPISFDLQLGVGKGSFDLSGLQIKDFNLSTGASDVIVSFDEPNKTTIDNINIESGVSKFIGRNLGNANFKRFRFQGGVGAYTLDFNGGIRNEVDVDVGVGFGILTIIVPQGVGARVFYEKSWASRLDCDSDIRPSSENEYVSDNYDEVPGKMNIRIDSGLGSIRVRRR